MYHIVSWSHNVFVIVANDNNKTGPIEIAENFSNFFTLKGTNLQKKIPPTKKTFTDYSKKTSHENLIKAPKTADEIIDLTHSLKSSKSVAPYSIPTIIMKISKEIISLPLS